MDINDVRHGFYLFDILCWVVQDTFKQQNIGLGKVFVYS